MSSVKKIPHPCKEMVCVAYDGTVLFFPPGMHDNCTLPHRFYSATTLQTWAGASWYVPCVASAAYGVMLAAPSLKEPCIGSGVVFVWNVFLAVFSWVGAFTTLSFLVPKVVHEGFLSSVCDDMTWFSTDAMGLALTAFVLSKPVELVDTVLLKLRGRPIIFLHWYHHVSVMFYTWHAFVTRSSLGPWFATMNYCVHALMYSYYALTQQARLRPRLVRVGPLITRLQISQMFVGIGLAMLATTTPDCNDAPANTRLALGMYTSYAVLFVLFHRSRSRLKKN